MRTVCLNCVQLYLFKNGNLKVLTVIVTETYPITKTSMHIHGRLIDEKNTIYNYYNR